MNSKGPSSFSDFGRFEDVEKDVEYSEKARPNQNQSRGFHLMHNFKARFGKVSFVS